FSCSSLKSLPHGAGCGLVPCAFASNHFAAIPSHVAICAMTSLMLQPPSNPGFVSVPASSEPTSVSHSARLCLSSCNNASLRVVSVTSVLLLVPFFRCVL